VSEEMRKKERNFGSISPIRVRPRSIVHVRGGSLKPGVLTRMVRRDREYSEVLLIREDGGKRLGRQKFKKKGSRSRQAGGLNRVKFGMLGYDTTKSG